MSILKWIFGKKEYISPQTLKHSSLGDYNTANRIIGGGHGQEALDYMKSNHIDHNIIVEYDNGVRAGNIPEHKKKIKKTGIGQSWFPKSWDRKKIRRAGQVVARGAKLPDGITKYGHYDNVNIGIIRTNSKIATIFPTSIQRNKNGKLHKYKFNHQNKYRRDNKIYGYNHTKSSYYKRTKPNRGNGGFLAKYF